VLAVRSGGGPVLDIQTVSAALTSTGLIDPAASEVLGLGPTAWPDVLSVELSPAGQQAVKLTVTVTPKPDLKLPPEAARKLIDNLTARVARSLKADGTERKEPLERYRKLEARQADLQKEQSSLRLDMEKVAVAMRSAPDRSGPDPLTAAREELADKTARAKALQAAFAEVQAARQPHVEAARALLAAREAVVSKLEAAASRGQATDLELARARAEAAEAKAQVTELSLSPVAEPRSRWFDTIAQMRMDIASLERRVEQGKAVAATAQPSRAELVAEQDRLNRLLAQKQMDLQQVAQQLEMARREAFPYNGQPEARLVVLGANEGN
jgi:hypothetical protein